MKKQSIITKVKQVILGEKPKTGGNVFDDKDFFSGSNTGNEFRTEDAQLKSYEKVAWVSIAVDALSTAGGGQEIFFTDGEGKHIDVKRLDESIWLPILGNGFASRGFSEWMKTFIAHRVLTGNALCLRSKKSSYGLINDTIEQFIPIYPGAFKPLVSSSGYELQGYEIRLRDGRVFTTSPEDVIHFTQNTNFNPFVGVGNITKMRIIAEFELNAEVFNNAFMKRQATPSLILSENTQLGEEDMKNRFNFLRDKYEGRHNAGKLMYLSGEDAKAYTVQIPQKDIQFLETKEFNRQTILSLFGVSPEAVGLTQNSNRATTGHEIANFHKRVNQLLEEFEMQINAQHVHRINPNVFVRFRKHVTGDVTAIKRMIEGGLITPNRGSELVGEPADESDEARNSYYMPSSLTPIGSNFRDKDQVADVEESEGKDDKEDKALKQNPDLSNPKNVEEIVTHQSKSLKTPKVFQERYLRRSLLSRNQIEDDYSYKLSTFFSEQGKRVRSRVQDQEGTIKAMRVSGQKILDEGSIDILFPLNEEDAVIKELTKSLFTAGIVKGITDVNDLTKSNVNPSFKNRFVKEAVNRLGRKVTRINETTRAALEQIILKAVDEGATIAQMQTAIQNKFASFSTHRSRLIARTESRLAWDQGAKIAYEELGVKKVDVVGCTGLSVAAGGDELNSSCGVQGTPIELMGTLDFHPNHIGAIVPSEEAL